MKRISTFQDTLSLYQPNQVFSVSDILKMYLTQGTIPVGANVRDYQYENREDFKGDFSKGGEKIDLINSVSRESRESAARKAAISSSQGVSPESQKSETPAASAPTETPTE